MTPLSCHIVLLTAVFCSTGSG